MVDQTPKQVIANGCAYIWALRNTGGSHSQAAKYVTQHGGDLTHEHEASRILLELAQAGFRIVPTRPPAPQDTAMDSDWECPICGADERKLKLLNNDCKTCDAEYRRRAGEDQAVEMGR